MEDNLEIYFCEICSESIPAKDLASRDALEVKGKVIGPCCLPAVQRPQARSGMSSVGMTALGAVVLAAIAGATIHLEWRLAEEVRVLEKQLSEVETNVASQGSRQIADLEKSIDQTAQKGDLDPVVKRVDLLEERLGKAQAQLSAKLGGMAARLGGLDESQSKIVAGQSAMQVAIKGVENEVLRLEREVANAVAAPRAMPVEAAAVERPADPAGAKAEPAAPVLPASLNHQVTRLKDADAGNRFEAVDQLVQSKDAAVLPYLLPMLKDPDAFVRRLTAEGLASFRDKTTVDALLVALADPESIVRHTAYGALRKLTKQSIAYDPDASSSARAQAQRRWKDWWDKSRPAF